MAWQGHGQGRNGGKRQEGENWGGRGGNELHSMSDGHTKTYQLRTAALTRPSTSLSTMLCSIRLNMSTWSVM